MNECQDNFEIFGDESLLKEIKLNVIKTSETGLEKKETLIFNGKKYIVRAENETGFVYKIYASYKDSLVKVMQYENILKGEENQINHFYFYKNKDIISFKFVGNKEFLPMINESPEYILVPLNKYFIEEEIQTEELKKNEKALFFDFYNK